MKLKTHRGMAKRVKVNKSGKVKFKKPNLRHNLTSKATKRKRHLRAKGQLAGQDVLNLKKLMPYA